MAAPELKFDVNTELAARRTGMSFQRTRMSADRTLMAVIRTSLSLIGFGFTIFQFFQRLREQEIITKAEAPRNFGLALVLLGIAMLVFGIGYHVQFMLGLRHMRESMREEGLIHGESVFPVSLTLITAFLLLLLGLAAFVSMAFRVGPFSRGRGGWRPGARRRSDERIGKRLAGCRPGRRRCARSTKAIPIRRRSRASTSIASFIKTPIAAARCRCSCSRRERPRAGREILVAGCGTSQAAIYAMREPDAHVTGIDLSESSLDHTRRLQQKHGLRNLDLRRLAIEDAGRLGRTFDHIVSTGVLHHLADPDAGLRSLRGVLAAGAALHVMVYAAHGRAGIYMMQEYCRLLGVPRDGERTGEPRQRRSAPCLLTIRSAPLRIGRRISGGPTRSPTRCFIRSIAPFPCRTSTPGLRDAALSSRAGSNRRPIFRNAGRSPACPTARGFSRCRRQSSTPRLSSCAGP